MKKVFSVCVAFALLLGISSLAYAGKEKKESAAESSEENPGKKKGVDKEKTKSWTGNIKSIDAKARTVTVVKKQKGVEKETVIVIKDDTKFKKVNALADLKVGDRIGVKYIEEGGKKIAKSVEFKIKKEGKAKGKKHRKHKKEKDEDDEKGEE